MKMKTMVNKPYVMIKQVFAKMAKENRMKRLKAPAHRKGDK